MINPHCRIRSVRRKNSPHLVEMMPRQRTSYRHAMHEYADHICDGFDDGSMALFAIAAIGFDGSWNASCKIAKESPIGTTILPAVLAEIYRRRNMEETACDIFNGKL